MLNNIANNNNQSRYVLLLQIYLSRYNQKILNSLYESILGTYQIITLIIFYVFSKHLVLHQSCPMTLFTYLPLSAFFFKQMADSEIAKIPRPKQMRGFLHSQIRRNLTLAILSTIVSGLTWKVFFANTRKQKYADFYK